MYKMWPSSWLIDLRYPQSYFQRRVSFSGRTYHRLDYFIEIAVQSALEFSISVDGKRDGSVTAKYA